jgi:FMN phosphatase YigB (HAD superfamily)
MFRVTAMGQFPPFADLTRRSLTRALAEARITLAPAQQDALAGAYRRLRPFDDARLALTALRQRGHSIVVFSVGPRAWLEELAAGYRDLVDGFVRADETVDVYKPHPGIYRHLLARRARNYPRRCWCPPIPSTSPGPVRSGCALRGASASRMRSSTPGDGGRIT